MRGPLSVGSLAATLDAAATLAFGPGQPVCGPGGAMRKSDEMRQAYERLIAAVGANDPEALIGRAHV